MTRLEAAAREIIEAAGVVVAIGWQRSREKITPGIARLAEALDRHANILGSTPAARNKLSPIDGGEDALMWPTTIILDRYMGAYAKAAWLAFDTEQQIPWNVVADDGECMTFWDTYHRDPAEWEAANSIRIGFGASPDEAALDLRNKREQAERLAASHTADVEPVE